MAGKIKGITLEIGGDASGLTKALSAVNKQTKSVQNELKEVDRLLKLDPKNTELLAQKQKLLGQNIDTTREKLAAMRAAKEQADRDMAAGTEVNEKQYMRLQREIAKSEQALKSLEKQSKETGMTAEKALKAVSDKAGAAGEKLTKAGNALLPVTAAVGALGVASSKMALDFEDAMAKVYTIADEAEVPLEQMEQEILNLSDQTGIAAGEIANNVYDAISAGQKTGDAVNFVTESTKLAKAGFAEAGQSLDVLTTILNAYGMEASEVNKVSDMLIQTQNKGKVTVGQLSSVMGKVIPTANAANVSLDQLCAGYAIMTSRGIAAAETTTYLNSMLNELSKSGTVANKTIKEQTGKSFQDLMKSGKSLAEVLKILEDTAKKNNKTIADMFGSAEAGKAALSLMADGVEGFNGQVAGMQDSVGATDAAFEKLQTPAEKMRKTLNNIKNGAIDLGNAFMETLAPMIEAVMDKIKQAIQWFKGMDAETKKQIVTAALVAAAVGPVLIVLGKLALGIQAVTKAMSFMVANPIAALITVLGALVAAAVAYNATLPDTQAELKETNQAVDDSIQSWEDLKAAQEEQLDSDLAQIDYTNRLWNELQTLADENGNVEEANKNRAQFILGELNNALGTEYSMTGLQIDRYKELGGSVDDLIAKKRAEIILGAQEEQYKTAIIEIDKRRADNAKLQREITESEIDLAQRAGFANFEAMEAAYNAGQIIDGRYRKEMETLNESKAKYEENSNVIREQLAIREGYEADYVALMNGNLDEIKGINAGVAESYKITGDETREEMRKKVYDSANIYADLLKEVENGNENIRKEELDAARAAYEQNLTEYEKAGGAIPEGLRVGQDGAIPALETSTSAFVGQIKSWFTGAEGFDANASPSNWSKNIGKWIVEGLWGGVFEKTGWLKECVSGFISKVKGWFTAKDGGFWTGSPSRWSEQLGQWIDEGLAIGIIDSEYKVSDAFKGMMADLDLQKDLSLISEEQYYEKMAEYRDEYIKRGTKEWWDYTKKLIAYEEQRVDANQDKILRDLKWWRDMGYKTDDEYYNELSVLKDVFWEKDSPEWQSAALEVKRHAEEVAKEAAESAVEISRDALENIKLDFDLWELTEGLNADGWTKRSKELEMLNAQYEEQTEIVEELAKQYAEMVALKGEDAEESRKLQKELKNERIAQAELKNEIGGKQGTVDPMAAGYDYSQWLGKYARQFHDLGYSDREVAQIGARATGYDRVVGEESMTKIEISQSFYTNAMSPSRVARETETAARVAALSF